MTFHVGQRVLCVATWSRNGLGYGHEIGPVKGTVYTVRQIGVGLTPKNPDGISLRLAEIANPTVAYREGMYEPTFDPARFRPLEERKRSTETGMAILRGLLDTSPVSLNEESEPSHG